MSDEQFWKCTPRRLFALHKVHAEIHSYKDDNVETGGTSNEDSFGGQWPSPDDPRLVPIDNI